MDNIQNRLDELITLLRQANDAIMEVYDADSAVVTIKEDDSPLTQADTASHAILMAGLAKLFPDIPIVSEEGDIETNKQLVSSGRFWLVDPLDGTKEFIARNGQFVVCAGLIEHDEPVFGITSSPVNGVVYYGSSTTGSFKVSPSGETEQLHVAAGPTNIIMGSRSHTSGPTSDYIAQHYPGYTLNQLGSLLKFLEIAEGRADAFPRIDSSMKLWDVAAGHAILSGAGGSITRPDGSPLNYHEPSLFIGDFVAKSK